ncbi:MAG: hypothetical protein MSC31_03685 [Solirubrobacteraceae bacterium MAG38_C4-C5]|nr:hypothetical protein [Candidatus Siliceabacter maunaloa]
MAEQPSAPSGPWGRRAAQAHATLLAEFRNTGNEGWPGLFRLRAPARVTDRLRWTYWWQAHALDALVANGPAAILAARLYARDGRPEDLRWAA